MSAAWSSNSDPPESEHSQQIARTYRPPSTLRSRSIVSLLLLAGALTPCSFILPVALAVDDPLGEGLCPADFRYPPRVFLNEETKKGRLPAPVRASTAPKGQS